MNVKYNSSSATLNYSAPLFTRSNRSDLLSNFTDLLEDFNRREHEQYLQYRPVACVFGVLIFLSNVTVVVSSGLILKKGQKTKSTYLLLGNVALADTIIGISMLVGVFIGNPVSATTLCTFHTGMLVCPAMVSIFSVGLIAIDRYIYILHGLYYHRWVNTTKVRLCIVAVWLIGVTLGFLPITGWRNYELNSRCYYVAVFPKPLILLNSILSIVPIIVVAVLYIIILIRALKNVKEINATVKPARSNSKPEMRIYRGNQNIKKYTQSVKVSAKNVSKLKRCSSFNSCYDVKDIKQRLDDLRCKSKSNDDLNKDESSRDRNIATSGNKFESGHSFCSTDTVIAESSLSVDIDPELNKEAKQIKSANVKDKTKWRAIIIVLLTTGSFICTWMPFFIIVIFYAFCDDKSTNPKCFDLRILLGGPIVALAFLNSILNPMIYVWWHKGFQRNVQQYLKRYIYPLLQKKSTIS